MFGPRLESRLIPWLLAMVFLAVQAIAFTHELQHDLRVHADPSCLLHLQAQQTHHTAAGIALPVVAAAPDVPSSPPTANTGIAPVLGYQTRAPPSSFVRSI